ncbi:DUF3085 domain-containing protein [Salmonella enterica subsp. houtenae]|uniref:DUF3085 domain-containing protein n=1 Tax=Salmonella houtenae TaxID=59205 RepID=A0A5Y2S944_SALHO|nr:DUF3085 domain-containing protein [Salmonella enterica]ECF6073010.1 DUF3085 domain-containing protein [Salmonella enterica subsp. houtenae]EDQ3688198.1 DUF3085 domain-containing protein [Salmonella enterica subsp. enterica serovar Bonariensis]EDT6887795.1 DUF3085 domain-containing protein [Salmonella enterica subsp. enterica]EDX8483689.1 DUF3085 domain-containing protein [Salmonella enterica subsp. enterica serovar Braenderup]MJC94322.1 hypothetical protein [Salmonella enterica subsp. enter
MLKFSAKDLTPVLQEARKNHCGVVLVKDHGVYIMSEIGALTSRGRKVAYAKGCHPDKDEAWWEIARAEVGGDDFGESIDLTESMMNRILNEGKPLHITVKGDSFLIEC